MIYRLGADLTLAVHLVFIVYVVFGGLLAIRWNRAWIVHLPALAWGVLIEFLWFGCPLTTLENFLRRSAGGAGYAGGLIDHYLSALIYPGLPQNIHIVLGTILFTFNIAIYGYLVWTGSLRLGTDANET